MRPLALSAFFLLLGGCVAVTTWHATGVSVARRQQDLALCEAAAFREYPVRAETRTRPHVFRPGYRRCDSAGNCVMTPPRWEGGERYTVDLNVAPRAAAGRACMAARGYTEVRLPACDRGPVAAPRAMPALSGQSCVVRSGPEGPMIVTP